MSARTWRGSNCALTAHLPQSVWGSAALCRETSADRSTGVKQIWRIACAACHLSVLATTMMVMNAPSNDAVVLQIPIAV